MLSANGLRASKNKEDRLSSYSVIVSKLTGTNIVWNDIEGFNYDKKRYFKSLVAHFYKACPNCIMEGSSNFSHRYLTSSYCHEHKLKLIERCQNCFQPFDVCPQVLNGYCSYCSYRIKPEYGPIPDYEKFLIQVEDKQRASVLFDLSSAAGLILRPFDSVASRIKTAYIYDTGKLFQEAFQLLTSNNARDTWLERARHIRKGEFSFLGQSGSDAGLNSVLNNLHYKWSTAPCNENKSLSFLQEPPIEEHNAAMFTTMKPLALRLLSDAAFNVYSRFKTTPEQLAEILGLPPKAVIVLMKKDILERSSKTNAYVYNQFDLRHIDKILASKSKDISGMVPIPFKYNLEQINSLLINLGANIEFVIEEAIKGTNLCRISHSQGQLSERIYCSKVGFLKFLMTRFIADRKRKIIESEAKWLFGLNDFDLRVLKMNKILLPVPHMHLYVYYYLGDLLDIDANLFNLGRYCQLRNLSFEGLSEKLKLVGIKPILGKSIFVCRQQVVRYLKFGEFQTPQTKITTQIKSSIFPF